MVMYTTGLPENLKVFRRNEKTSLYHKNDPVFEEEKPLIFGGITTLVQAWECTAIGDSIFLCGEIAARDTST